MVKDKSCAIISREIVSPFEGTRGLGRREISIGSCRDFRKRDENLDNECSEACKKPEGKNRWKMIQRRIESIHAIETDIASLPASFRLLN